jgi:hypothetical protein
MDIQKNQKNKKKIFFATKCDSKNQCKPTKIEMILKSI